MVPADNVAEARLALAHEGLPAGGSIGYEIFDRSDGFAATDFQQKINETRALEGEIARTIRAMRGIRAVRVHLVLPRREPFARERQDAQASVMLTMAGVGRLDHEGIQAIVNLVAAAVPVCGRRTSPSLIYAATCWRALASRLDPPRPRSPPRRSGARPNCSFHMRSRRCWSPVWAPATCVPRPRFA